MIDVLRKGTTLAVLLLLLWTQPSTLWAAPFTYTFDNDHADFVGHDGWDGAYCNDSWTTALNGGVTPKTDDGCGPDDCIACDYEFAKFNGCSQSDPFDNHIHVGSELWKDYVYRVKFRNTDDDAFGVVFRYTNSGSFYLFVMSRAHAPSATMPCTETFLGSRLYKTNWPDGVQVLGTSDVTYEQGVIHEIRVTAEGAHIQVELDVNGDGQFSDSEAVFDIIDPSPHLAGSVGLFAYDNGAAGNNPCLDGSCWFDDLQVDVLAVASDPCDGISFEGACEGNTLKWCDAGSLNVSQCQGCCKWDAGNQFYNCLWGGDCTGGCVNECSSGTSGCNDALTHYVQCLNTDNDPCTELVQTPCASFFCDPVTDQCAASPCDPNCTGKVCGGDGCGGSCGQCPGGQQCVGGQCQCLPDCDGKQCGDDGCGGSCGNCTGDEEACVNGQCQCQVSCVGKVCGDDGCGGLCGDCVGQDICQGGQCVCLSDCTAKECGADGCGGDCGICPEGQKCQNFTCACAPACEGLQCGGDGCGGVCGDCGPDLTCVGGLCLCVGTCEGMECGEDGCGNSCGTCLPGTICVKGACECVADCTGKVCGDDLCGGSCGSCPVGWACQAGECVEGPCVPDCTDKQCGDDGCGGACGTCGDQEICLAYQCQCVPDCDDKQCGPDGCGNDCGECDGDGEICEDFACVCIPFCEGAECGDDGCDGLCGECAIGHFCEEGSCIEGECIPDCAGKDCGFDGCSGVCGECAPDQECDDGVCKIPGCVPFCEGKECGPDGCGSWCGGCPDGHVCGNGSCVCVPSCAGKECGDDGCGSGCGGCTPGYVCSKEYDCVPEEECQPEEYAECQGETLYWYDSCGQQGAIKLVCGYLCVDGACVPEPVEDIVAPDVDAPDVTGDVSGSQDSGNPLTAEPVTFSSPGKKSGGCSQTASPNASVLLLFAVLCVLLRVSPGRRKDGSSWWWNNSSM